MRIIIIGLSLLCLSSSVFAQPDGPQVSLGGHYSALALDYPEQRRSGGGGWVAYDGLGPFGLDVAMTLFAGDNAFAGRVTQLLAGARSGIRRERFAAFARVRPGVTRFGRRFMAPEIVCIAIFPTPEACLTLQSTFTLDIGGTVQLFIPTRSVLRIDVGDAIIRFDRRRFQSTWRHNLQITAGAGLRF